MLLVVRIVRFYKNFMQVQSKSTVFAWWINYTFPERYGKKKKRETKRRVDVYCWPCSIFRKIFLFRREAFNGTSVAFTSSLLTKKKKRKKEQFVMCTYNAWQRIQFSLLSTIDLSRCREPRLWCIPWVSSEKNFTVVVENGENPDK